MTHPPRYCRTGREGGGRLARLVCLPGTPCFPSIPPSDGETLNTVYDWLLCDRSRDPVRTGTEWVHADDRHLVAVRHQEEGVDKCEDGIQALDDGFRAFLGTLLIGCVLRLDHRPKSPRQRVEIEHDGDQGRSRIRHVIC